MDKTEREIALEVALLDAARMVEALTATNKGQFYPSKVREWRRLAGLKGEGLQELKGKGWEA